MTELIDNTKNNIFSVVGPSKTKGRTVVKAWDGNTYNIPDTMDANTFAEKLRDKKGPDLFGSISAATQYSVPQLYRTAMASVFDTLGMEEDQAEQEKLAKENEDLFNKVAGQYAIPSFTDIPSDQGFLQSAKNLATFASQQIGFSAPQMAASIGGAAVGATYGSALAGGAAASAPFFYAMNVDRQRQEKQELKEKGIISDIEYDQGKALIAAGVQAGLEGLVGSVLFNGNLLTKNLANLGYKPGTPATQSFLKTMGHVAATNAATEVGQQFAERWQADLPLLDDEAKKEYLEAGVSAAIVGVPLGALGSFTRPKAEVKNATAAEDTQDPVEEVTPELNPILAQLEKTISDVTIAEASPQFKNNTPNEIISSTFDLRDDNRSFGIENIAQAKEFIVKRPNGFNYLKSLEASNASEGLIIESARNGARFADLQSKYSLGVSGQNYSNRAVLVDSEAIGTQHSDEPRILNMAAILQSKYNYPTDHIKGLSDSTLEKLFRIKTDQDEQKLKALPKPEEQKLLPPYVPDDMTDLPEAPRTQRVSNQFEPDSVLDDFASPFEIPNEPTVEFQKQLLDSEIGNEVADPNYVRKVNQEAPLKNLTRLAKKLENLEQSNRSVNDPSRKAQQRQQKEQSAPQKKLQPRSKEEFKKATKKKPVENSEIAPVTPEDFTLSVPAATPEIIAKKEQLLNQAMASQLREPSKYTKDLDLQKNLKGYFDGALYETARAYYGEGSPQVDLFVFNQFIKLNYKPENIKSLVNKHKVLLSSKLGILPRDLDFWGDSIILQQGLKEFTENRDKAFGNDIFKRFLNEQKTLKDYYKTNIREDLATPSSGRKDVLEETILKADKILQETPVGKDAVKNATKEADKVLDKLDKLSKKPDWNTEYYTSILASMKGMARKNPYYARALNLALAKEDIAAEIVNDVAVRFNKNLKSPNFQTFFDILSHLKETDQDIKTNEKGEIVFLDENKKPKKLDLNASAEFILHSNMYKHMGRLAFAQAKKQLNEFNDLGLSEKSTAKDVQRVVSSLDEQIKTDLYSEDEKQKAVLNRDSLKDALKSFVEMERMQKENKPYVPFMRFGDSAIVVKDKQGKVVWMEDWERPSFSGELNPPTDKEINDFIACNKKLSEYKKNKDFTVAGFQKTYNNLQKFLPNSFITNELVASVLNSTDPTLVKTVSDFENSSDASNELQQAIANPSLARERILRYIMSKGAGKFFQKSENIPGYSKEGKRVFQAHVETMARLVANMQTAPEYASFFKDVQINQMPEWQRKQLNDYMEYMQSPTSENGFNRFVRTFNFVWTMGLNPSTAMLQLVTVPTHIMPAMNQTGYNPITDTAAFLNNVRKVSAFIVGPDTPDQLKGISKFLSKDELAVVSKHKEVLQASAKSDALGISSQETESFAGKTKKATEKAVNFSGILIDRMEKLTRYSMFLTVYNKLKKNPNGVKIFENMHKDNEDWKAFKDLRKEFPIEEAIAHFQVRDIHAIFGKAGRGYSQRGYTGSMVFPFTTYVAQTLERMYDLGVNRGMRGKAELAQTMAVYVALAGLAGIPGYELAEELSSQLLSYMTGIRTSVKKDIREYVEKNGLDSALVEKGLLSTMTGTDVGDRIGLQIVVGKLLSDAFNPKDVDASQYNPTIGMIPKIGQSVENAIKGKDFLETIDPVLPQALRNINQSYAYANERMLETAKGKPLPLKEPISSNDLSKRALGFTPLKVAEARDDLFFGKSFDKSKYNVIKGRYADMIANLKFKAMKEPEKATVLNKEINSLYNEFRQTLARDPEFKPTADFWRGFNTSIKTRIEAKKKPEVNVK